MNIIGNREIMDKLFALITSVLFVIFAVPSFSQVFEETTLLICVGFTIAIVYLGLSVCKEALDKGKYKIVRRMSIMISILVALILIFLSVICFIYVPLKLCGSRCDGIELGGLIFFLSAFLELLAITLGCLYLRVDRKVPFILAIVFVLPFISMLLGWGLPV